jgi:2'-5' RNA ligase
VSDERARLFVALELPVAARGALARWREGVLRGGRGLRPVAADSLHVTLCFLGWRAVDEIEAIGAACEVAASQAPPELSFGDAVWLPARRPRVLAVELDDPGGELAGVQAELSKALQAGGWYAPEPRGFLAHVTVARLGKGARARPRELPAVPALDFTAPAVTLLRSRLGPGGAQYEPLRRVELGSAPGPSDPLSVVERFHAEQARAYGGGELDALREVLSDNVVWHVPGRSAIAGEHRGLEAVLAYFETRRRMTDATFRVTVRGTAMIGDRVVQLADGSAERDGRTLTWSTAGVFRVADGRVAECWLVPFDLYAFDEIWS